MRLLWHSQSCHHTLSLSPYYIFKVSIVTIRVLRGEEWQLERNLILKEGKVYMLKDEELRVEII